MQTRPACQVHQWAFTRARCWQRTCPCRRSVAAASAGQHGHGLVQVSLAPPSANMAPTPFAITHPTSWSNCSNPPASRTSPSYCPLSQKAEGRRSRRGSGGRCGGQAGAASYGAWAAVAFCASARCHQRCCIHQLPAHSRVRALSLTNEQMRMPDLSPLRAAADRLSCLAA